MFQERMINDGINIAIAFIVVGIILGSIA